MARICPVCGYEIGFFTGKFIAEKYVCKSCFEEHMIEESDGGDEKKEWNAPTSLELCEAHAKAYKYKPWSWRNNKSTK